MPGCGTAMRQGGTSSSEGPEPQQHSQMYQCQGLGIRDAQGKVAKNASVKRAQNKEGKAVIRGKATAHRREVTGGGRCRKQVGM